MDYKILTYDNFSFLIGSYFLLNIVYLILYLSSLISYSFLSIEMILHTF